jgi:phosphatidate cytidylyltransferase
LAVPETRPTPTRRLAGLGTRVLAGALFGPCFVLIAWRGESYFVLLVNLLLVTAAWEYHRILSAKGSAPDLVVGVAAALLLPWSMYIDAGAYSGAFLTVLFLAVPARALAHGEARNAATRMGLTAFGILYVAWLGSHLVLLRELPLLYARDYGDGFRFVLVLFLFMWLSDTGAYLVGSLWGRRRLAPRISPGKSVEGSVAALLLTALAGVVASWTFMRNDWNPIHGAAIGVLASAVGQMGNLLESLLKRDAAVKDASLVIPGHGGVLDRFDSALLAAPLLYYALRLFVL